MSTQRKPFSWKYNLCRVGIIWAVLRVSHVIFEGAGVLSPWNFFTDAVEAAAIVAILIWLDRQGRRPSTTDNSQTEEP